MFFSLNQIIAIIAHYKYLVLFPIVVVEGPIAITVSGFLSYHGIMNLFIAYPLVVVADIIGDFLYYIVGRFGRKKIIDKWGHRFGITAESIEKSEKYFKNHGGKTLVLGKFAPGPGGAALIAAGMAKMNFFKFALYSIFGTIPKSLVLILIGFYFGDVLERINAYFGMLEAIFTGLFILVIIGLIFYKRHKQSKIVSI